MTTYRVTYEIDIEADCHTNAAREVCNIFQDPESFRPIFDVEQWPTEQDPPPFTCDRTNVVCIDCEDIKDK